MTITYWTLKGFMSNESETNLTPYMLTGGPLLLLAAFFSWPAADYIGERGAASLADEAESLMPLMIMAVYFLSLWSGVAAVQAKTSPDVSLTCDQPAPIEVYPGALRSTIIYCTLTNPTTFSEKVDLTYQQGIISVAGPGSATVPDRKSTRLNSSHSQQSRMPSSA